MRRSGLKIMWGLLGLLTPLEKVYFVLEGEMTVTDKDGNKYVIHKNESISFPPNEGRGLKNESGKPAKMLVIINYPDAQ